MTNWYLIYGGLLIIAVLVVIWCRHKVSQDPNYPLQHEVFDFETKKEYYEKLTGIDNEGNHNQN